MEDELKCPVCHHYFTQPVLLPCFHSLCLHCAVQGQQAVTSGTNNGTITHQHDDDSDQLSILSETDSGVVVSSRPSSYLSPVAVPAPPPATLSLSCPVCRKVVYFDEHGAQNLPRYKAMQTIVDKFVTCKGAQGPQSAVTLCHLCPEQPSGQQEASVFCQQCQIFYCDECRDKCHPSRGPLAKHSLVSPAQGRLSLRSNKEAVKSGGGDVVNQPFCPEHVEETLNYFCNTCKTGACHLCVLQGDGRHQQHDVHLVALICKQQKAELTQSLQQLSEKAKSATEVIQRLKSSSENVQESCVKVEEAIHAQCLELMEVLRRREEALVEFARRERDLQLRRLREEVATCTAHLQHTTALVQFCIEALKEPDSSAFLQIGSMLVNRVSNLDLTWRQEMEELSNRASPTLELTLDDLGLRRSIEQMTFLEMKPPGAPRIVAEECSAENNSITVAWQAHPASFVEGFILELDDGGTTGRFREVYCGKENICTLDGLHFNSLYNARVKAFNSSGEGPYSEPLGLHTAEVAWFTFDTTLFPLETRLSADGLTATTDSYEPRVLLSSVGFSRGVHYWEFTIHRYDGTADPAFGVARRDVTRDTMLGKDDKGWSMYIDHQRSWFLHNNVHSNRTDGGIEEGSTVGVLLDLDRRQLSFYVNEEAQGSVAFTDLCGVFYPAVSLNRNVQVTLHSALDPPSVISSCQDSGEESDECQNAIDASDRTSSITCAMAAL